MGDQGPAGNAGADCNVVRVLKTEELETSSLMNNFAVDVNCREPNDVLLSCGCQLDALTSNLIAISSLKHGPGPSGMVICKCTFQAKIPYVLTKKVAFSARAKCLRCESDTGE